MFILEKYRFVLASTLLIGISLAGIAFSLDIKEIMTRLSSGDVVINITQTGETVVLNGPVDFSHKGRNLKGDSGTIVLKRDPDNDYRTPVSLRLDGRIEYNDKEGFSGGSRGGGDFNFIEDNAVLENSAWIKGQDFSIDADIINYDIKNILFTANGNVIHKGTTQSLHFDRVIGSIDSNELGISGEYALRCNDAEFDYQNGQAKAEGSIRLQFRTASFQSDRVDILFDQQGVTSISAFGNVEFRNPYIETIADKVQYSQTKEQLVMGSDKTDKKITVVYKGQHLEGVQVIINMSDDDESIEILDSVITVHPDFKP